MIMWENNFDMLTIYVLGTEQVIIEEINKEASSEKFSLSQYIHYFNCIHTTHVLHRLERMGLAQYGVRLGILGILRFRSWLHFICVYSRASV